ncbi:MAG TPA: metalloregulator ArsR/SmtB family transcription factor [Candidatus Nitrosotalea sp.]|nr:metalloregulator ArsR/SmtB family transcription factor [Candidatus Nitrosotalea sp.]
MSMQQCCAPRHGASKDRSAEAALLKAVADPYRFQMVAMLAAAREEVCVCDFTEALPLNQPTVSHHLRILREAELVSCERRGTWVYYQLAEDAQQRLQSAISTLFNQKVRP